MVFIQQTEMSGTEVSADDTAWAKACRRRAAERTQRTKQPASLSCQVKTLIGKVEFEMGAWAVSWMPCML